MKVLGLKRGPESFYSDLGKWSEGSEETVMV